LSLLRRLLGRVRRAPSPDALRPEAPPDAGQVSAAALLWWRQQGVTVHCVDARPLSALRYGFVEGALLLPPGQEALAPQGGVVVWVGREAGLWTGGLGPWEDAGWPLRAPEWKAPLPLLHPVSLGGEDGWVQDIVWAPDGFRFTVVLVGGRRVAGLEEEALVSRGPRGAAGLGRQL